MSVLPLPRSHMPGGDFRHFHPNPAKKDPNKLTRSECQDIIYNLNHKLFWDVI